MKELRLFIALTLPDTVLDSLESLQTGLPDVRWTPASQMHVTLKFLGDVADQTAEEMAHAIQEIQQPPLELRLAGLGHFPQKKAFPVLWAGLEPEETLLGLHAKVESFCGQRGLARDKRRFLPHITLGRMKRNHPRRLREYLELHHELRSAPFLCDHLALFSSQLSPSGAHHEVLGSVLLQGDSGPGS